MTTERTAALHQAEELLRLGHLEQAIAEYRRLVEEQPRDWNTANVLGDLYVQAGQVDHAVEQFARLAAILRHEGFLPKAFALYKKILKLRPDIDYALMQAGILAAEQGLLADARTLLASAAAACRRRGDTRGALDAVVRLAGLDPRDVEARMAGARSRHELDDVPGALTEFAEIGLMLVADGREHEALAPLREVMALDPANTKIAGELARILLAEGRTTEALACFPVDVVEGDARLMAVSAILRLVRGEADAALRMVDRLLARGSEVRKDVTELSLALAAVQPAAAFRVVDRIATACLAESDRSGALEHLERFLFRAPRHAPALARLAELRAERTLGDVADVEPARNPHAIDLERVFGRPAPPPVPALEEPVEAPPPAPPADLEQVFARLREEAAQRPSDEAADIAYTRGVAMADAGDLDDAMEQLRAAARAPRRRFSAASLLAQIHEQLGHDAEAIEWLGHAVDAPGVGTGERCDTLLRLADLLERSGEVVRALAVCLELQADGGDDKDLAARITRLSGASGG